MKFKAILILSIINVIALQAQENDPVNKIVFLNQKKGVLQECLEKGLVIIEQQYAAKDASGQLFGREGKEYFNFQYYIGAFAEDKIVIPAEASNPGLSDFAFVSFVDQYKSVPVTHFYKPITGKRFKKIESEIMDDDFTYLPFKSDSIVGFKFLDYRRLQSPKLILLHIELNEDPKVANIHSNIINIENIQWDENGKGLIDKPVEVISRKIIGGALFDFTVDTGSINATLVALYCNNGKQWYLQSLEKSGENSDDLTKIVPVTSSKNSKSKKGKKSRK
ncbi:hypothetical protein BH23BAC1_BH23BAC1_25460 [soil metagenome]